MFLRNRTNREVVLARSHLGDDLAVASVNLEVRYSVDQSGSLTPIDGWQRKEGDPPDIRELPVWAWVSLTASGAVLGPTSPPFVKEVRLAWNGGGEHRLAVFGPRWWRRSIGGLQATEPQRFDAVPLTWRLAFGGSYQIPPGLDPHSGLPHPGGTMSYPLNGHGVGFYATAAEACDQPLPAIERPDQLIRGWSDHPVPGGLSPCRELPGLRLDGERAAAAWQRRSREDLVEALAEQGLRGQHHAPAATLLEKLDPGDPLRLEGLGSRPLELRLPPSPVAVVARRGKQRDEVPSRIRSVHLDGDDGTVAIVYGHLRWYAPGCAPEWFDVKDVGVS